MKNFFRNIFFFILFPLWGLGGFGWGAYAQLYPVQVAPIFNSPYSVKLSDYATSIDTKLQLLINPTDIAITNRQVRLKFYLQGNGINAQSSDYIQGERPIFINGGELQTLTNVDITALFRLENLQGISPAQYANPLPEGMYSFCFELYDFVTNQKISQKSCANLYLVLNDPPLLNTPQRNELIAATEFPNILFTWTPRQINATNVSYKFELKQLFDPTLDPQIGFQMAPILHEETLFATALVYNLSMPILTPGMRYAWRVKAISTSGLSENVVFKNDGYSEIYSFKYTATCLTPTFLLSETQSSKSAKITWQGVSEHTLYQLQYKKQNVANARWFSSNSLNTQSLLTNLEPGTTYEFRVGASCDSATEGIQSFTYSGSNTFTTPTTTNGTPAYSCGIIPSISLQNQIPIVNLLIGEIFTAGDFPVRITDLSGSGGQYSGKGVIEVPYLENLKLSVKFENISINTNYQLFNGVVETAYDSSWKNVITIDPLIEEIFGPQSGSEIVYNTDTVTSEGTSDDGKSTDEPITAEDTNSNPDASSEEITEPKNTSNTNNTEAGTNTTTVPKNTNGSQGNENSNSNNSSSGKGYFIEYKNKKYYTGDKIQIPFNRNSLATNRFKMGELNKETNVKYELGYQSEQGVRLENVGGNNYLKKTESQTEADFDFSFDNALKYQLKSIADTDKKPSLSNEINVIVKTFKPTSLKAIDNSNTKRFASNGETLYFVSSKDYKDTKFQITYTPNLSLDEIPKDKIKWKFNDTFVESKNGENNFSQKINKNKDIIAEAIAGYPTQISKKVDVRWVSSYDANVDLFQKFNKVITFLQEFNKISAKFGKVLPCQFSALNNIEALKQQQKASLNLRTYNEEDISSREIFDITQTAIKLKSADLMSLKCSKSIGIGPVSLGNVYISASLGSSIDFNYKVKISNEKKITKTDPNISGGFNLTFKGGLESNPEFTDYIFANANLNTSAGTKSIWPYNGDSTKVGNYFYVGNTSLSVEGYVDGWLVGGKKNFNFSFVLLETKWESEKKLIFDVKNGEIYTE